MTVGRDNASKTMMKAEFRNMLGSLDGEDEYDNFLGYDFFRDRLISQEKHIT